MRKVIVLIRVLFVMPALPRAVFSLTVFYLLILSEIYQAKLDLVFDDRDTQKFDASIIKPLREEFRQVDELKECMGE